LTDLLTRPHNGTVAGESGESNGSATSTGEWVPEPVRIVPYDPLWPERFQHERGLLELALGDLASGGIHHVGSTAVPGLAAKPVIDILVGVRDLRCSRDAFEALAGLQYVYAPYRSQEMHWFCKPNPSKRTHHLHLVPTGSPRFQAELEFRDRLRSQPQLAERYRQLKQVLAAEYELDREAYTDAKGEFINVHSKPRDRD
jgi:GrpB-like predicted nucleotidyltransferase (UPF0157 family)